MSIDRFFSILAGYMDQYAVLPILYHFHWMEWDDLSFDWCLVCMYGLFAVLVTYAVCWPLEHFFPIERWQSQKAVLTDVFYTLLNRVGVIPIITFLLFYQAQTAFTGWVVDMGFVPPTLDSMIPGLFGHAILTFWVYALILDCADYWRHRLSHVFDSWYALHALHHAQRQMSFWSDDRNHFFDDLIAFVWFFVIGLAIGIPPLQFPLLVLLLRFIESLSHANIKLSFGPLEPILVSPRFHRLHHALRAAGHNSCNYAGVFSLWDVIFRTADFSPVFLPTGDPTAPEALATGGYLEQQICGAKLFFATLFAKRRPLGGQPG
jgi:sterol desaturase/sphingolipid hydroxylase (fatty acid hydroxylase superfamily)